MNTEQNRTHLISNTVFSTDIYNI